LLAFQGVNFLSGYDDGSLTMALCPASLSAQSDKRGAKLIDRKLGSFVRQLHSPVIRNHAGCAMSLSIFQPKIKLALTVDDLSLWKGHPWSEGYSPATIVPTMTKAFARHDLKNVLSGLPVVVVTARGEKSG
jgi:hypothetical protein